VVELGAERHLDVHELVELVHLLGALRDDGAEAALERRALALVLDGLLLVLLLERSNARDEAVGERRLRLEVTAQLSHLLAQPRGRCDVLLVARAQVLCVRLVRDLERSLELQRRGGSSRVAASRAEVAAQGTRP